ncbi:hypothetical protein Q0M94_14950 [Deinococcus radiomollis]|uniref:hypothetical protein n=1 Tax=Deinococcus radiomollis TaxID=468916 RepID=UPI003891C9CE
MSAGKRVSLLGLSLLCVLLMSAAPAPTPLLATLLQTYYDAWTPVDADTTPLALLRRRALDWNVASEQLAPLIDEGHAYAELRGAVSLPDGRQSMGVWRAAVYRKNTAEAVLVLNDEWCAAGLCKARTRFVLLRAGQPDVPLAEAQLVPRIADGDLLDPGPPACLKGVTLGVVYLPSRFDVTLTAMATVPPAVRTACEASGVELALVTRPLRLSWNASARKFTKGW